MLHSRYKLLFVSESGFIPRAAQVLGRAPDQPTEPQQSATNLDIAPDPLSDGLIRGHTSLEHDTSAERHFPSSLSAEQSFARISSMQQAVHARQGHYPHMMDILEEIEFFVKRGEQEHALLRPSTSAEEAAALLGEDRDFWLREMTPVDASAAWERCYEHLLWWRKTLCAAGSAGRSQLTSPTAMGLAFEEDVGIVGLLLDREFRRRSYFCVRV